MNRRQQRVQLIWQQPQHLHILRYLCYLLFKSASCIPMSEVKSCGFLIVRGEPIREFLLMRHADRWDLPKGHVDPGETERECALRELHEETGISPADIDIVKGFRFTTRYQVKDKRREQPYEKEL